MNKLLTGSAGDVLSVAGGGNLSTAEPAVVIKFTILSTDTDTQEIGWQEMNIGIPISAAHFLIETLPKVLAELSKTAARN